ncbi:rab-GTPase-TBC domain-containing protein [Gongronella butleri]|nr:rab-GTPase-TBC domain-containing protein [Gongronella butleri]
MSTELLAVRHHLSIGIPPALRGNMWQLIAKSQNQQTDMDSVYTELSKRTSLYEKSIQHDLENAKPITKCLDQFQLDPDATRPKMMRLLKAYSLFDPDIGYHQALAFLLITILHEIDDETAAFCLLVQLTGVYGLNGSLNQSTDTLEMLLYRLDHLLQMSLPELHRHMEATGLTPDVYASHWLTTCFAYGSPSAALTTHVMDLVLVQGTTVLDQFILALLKRNEQAMLTMGFEALVAFLQSEVFDVYNSQPNQWVIDMYQMDLSPKLYARLEKQYRVETMRRTRQRNDDEAVRQANDQLMSYLQEVQEKYRVLELEHQDVTRQAVETKLAMAKLDAENDDLRHQLSLMRHQFDDDQREAGRIHDAKMQEANHSNEQLKKHCTSLENQITDLEAILISLKMKYAEHENEYDYLRRELNEYKKNAQK